MALFLSLIATCAIVSGAATSGRERGATLVGALGAYWFGAGIGAVVIGWLRPAIGSKRGSAVAGVATAVPVFTSMWIAQRGARSLGEPRVALAVILVGIAFGCAVGLLIRAGVRNR